MGPGDPASPARARTTPSARTPKKPLDPPTHTLSLSLSSLSPLPKKVRGLYQDRPPLPFTPGAELAGTVIEAGPGCEAGPAVGAAVLAITLGGGFAEEAVVPAAACVALPPGTPLEEAAGLAVAYGTADLALAKAGVTPANGRDHTILVSGAAGGVGAAAVQLASAAGARVIALARGPVKAAALARLGAAAVLDPAALPPGTKRVRDAVAAVTGGPRKVTAFLDNVGGALFEEGLRCLGWGGTACVIGFASGAIPKVPANLILLNSLAVRGVYWGPSRVHEPAAFTASLARLVGQLAGGGLAIPVSHRVPLDRWKEGWAALAERRAVGKVVVVCGGGGAGAAAAGCDFFSVFSFFFLQFTRTSAAHTHARPSLHASPALGSLTKKI